MEKTGRITLITLQAVWFLLLISSVLFPLFFLVSFIPLLGLTTIFYIKNIRLNFYFMLVILVSVCVIRQGDFAYVLFTVLMFAGLIGLLWGLKWRSYLAGAGITSLIMIAFIILMFVIYCPLNNKNPQDFIMDYAAGSAAGDSVVFSTDSQFKSLSKSLYYNYNEKGFIRLEPQDEGYDQDRIRVFKAIMQKGVDSIYSYISTVGAVVGMSSFILVYLINKKTPKLTLKSFHEFIVHTEPIEFRNMRLNRKYFVYVFLPALVFWILSLFNAFSVLNPVALAIYCAFSTAPGAAAALSFIYHTVGRIKIKSFKVYLYALWWVLTAFVTLFPFAAFIVSFLGILDSVIPLRRVFDAIFKSKEETDEN